MYAGIKHSYKVDSFSVGVIGFLLVARTLETIDEKNYAYILNNIDGEIYRKKYPFFQYCNTELVLLLKALLKTDEESRASIETALLKVNELLQKVTK